MIGYYAFVNCVLKSLEKVKNINFKAIYQQFMTADHKIYPVDLEYNLYLGHISKQMI